MCVGDVSGKAPKETKGGKHSWSLYFKLWLPVTGKYFLLIDESKHLNGHSESGSWSSCS